MLFHLSYLPPSGGRAGLEPATIRSKKEPSSAHREVRMKLSRSKDPEIKTATVDSV